ncbi:sensor histidine kinase [Sphingopyxis fribergensis]
MPRPHGSGLAPWRSTSGRFALLSLAICLACVVPILGYVYHEIDRLLLAEFQRPLEYRQGNLLKHFDKGGIAELQTSVASRASRAYQDQTAILLVDREGRKLAGNLVSWPEDMEAPREWTPVRLHREGSREYEEFLVLTTLLPSGDRLLLGGLLDNRASMQGTLLRALFAAFALAIPIGLLGSLLVVREMNRMVTAISGVGDHVAAGDLARRADVDGSGDPVDRLKLSLNAMLDRIETLVEEHRTLTDALAHDLRSPLTHIHIQVAQALDDAPGSDQRARFDVISQELERLLHMLESALEISRAEAGIGRGDFECFDAGEMLRDLCEIYQPAAQAAGVRMTAVYAPGLAIQGNHGLVARALANLIDNALKYGADGREITLEASATSMEVLLSVADRAKGIPAAQHAEAMRKFGRLDRARSKPGSGLGLSLVKAVASLHRGNLVLAENAPGLRATLALPRCTASHNLP